MVERPGPASVGWCSEWEEGERHTHLCKTGAGESCGGWTKGMRLLAGWLELEGRSCCCSCWRLCRGGAGKELEPARMSVGSATHALLLPLVTGASSVAILLRGARLEGGAPLQGAAAPLKAADSGLAGRPEEHKHGSTPSQQSPFPLTCCPTLCKCNSSMAQTCTRQNGDIETGKDTRGADLCAHCQGA